MRFDIGTLDSGERRCPLGYLFSDVRLSLLHKKGTYLRKYFNALQHEQDKFKLCIKQYRLFKVYYILNENISTAMEVPRFRCLLEFQGVTEQKVSLSPKFLMN